ncbi:hypothetical protein BX666DRAFT_548679 [Dichotomocladium elegans]|nr:hypothetical protein BX666DRAFT_548679 [Dichotomocladium elegans]
MTKEKTRPSLPIFNSRGTFINTKRKKKPSSMAQCTLTFGHYNSPMIIADTITSSAFDSTWQMPSDVLSVAFFVTKPPSDHPTRAKQLLEPASTATQAEREFLMLLSQSMAKNKSFGILDFRSTAGGILGILSPHGYPSFALTLQWVDFGATTMRPLTSQMEPFPHPLAPDRLPMEMMDAIQHPGGHDRVRAIAKEMYRIATVYGYWDLWRVLEGICQRFQLDPQQLISG